MAAEQNPPADVLNIEDVHAAEIQFYLNVIQPHYEKNDKKTDRAFLVLYDDNIFCERYYEKLGEESKKFQEITENMQDLTPLEIKEKIEFIIRNFDFPDEIFTEFDSLPDSARQIFRDIFYNKYKLPDYTADCTAETILLLRDFLIKSNCKMDVFKLNKIIYKKLHDKNFMLRTLLIHNNVNLIRNFHPIKQMADEYGCAIYFKYYGLDQNNTETFIKQFHALMDSAADHDLLLLKAVCYAFGIVYKQDQKKAEEIILKNIEEDHDQSAYVYLSYFPRNNNQLNVIRNIRANKYFWAEFFIAEAIMRMLEKNMIVSHFARNLLYRNWHYFRHVPSLHYLAKCYEIGHGGPVNVEKAMELYKIDGELHGNKSSAKKYELYAYK